MEEVSATINWRKDRKIRGKETRCASTTKRLGEQLQKVIKLRVEANEKENRIPRRRENISASNPDPKFGTDVEGAK